ncbi:hypothetical protein [Mesorhizobium sp. M1322]|uniref:hypothetical protein n=1 Tax=Mesorhizobium sp. M1322 TaxID=2957081 RepID=UPI003337293F
MRDAFYMTAAADAQAGQRNWKADTFNLTPTGTIAFEADRGYTGNGVDGYLATGFTPSTAGGNFALNACHLSFWSRTDAQNNTVSMGSRTASTTAQALIIPRTSLDAMSLRMNVDASPTNIAGSTNSSGGFVSRRSASNAAAMFRNGVSIGSHTVASTALPAAAIVIGAVNTGGVIGSFNNYQFASAGFGGGLTDAMILAEYNADLAYLQGVGAA